MTGVVGDCTCCSRSVQPQAGTGRVGATRDMSKANGTNLSVIPAEYLDLLDSTALANVATIGPSGAPQVSPVWFGWDGTHIRFSQSVNAQKLKNLQRDARVALAIVDPANPYRYLEVRGRVVAVDPDPNYTYLDLMSVKYLGLETYPYKQAGSTPVIIVIEPTDTSQMTLNPPSRK
jgi:PPOX class probable F420-dependent enzyme